jgi:hypothetical protein
MGTVWWQGGYTMNIVTPDFSDWWKKNNSYGFTLVVDTIYANVSPQLRNRQKGDAHYVASVQLFGTGLNVQQSGFTSLRDAQTWCEPWIAHFYTHLQLQKQLEIAEGWLHHHLTVNNNLKAQNMEQYLQINDLMRQIHNQPMKAESEVAE